MKILSIILPLLMYAACPGAAQTMAEIKHAKTLFEGAWINKKDRRHLTISIENDGYITINDWVGKWKGQSVDAYKAFIRKGKLIIPADTDHHGPYSELYRIGNTMVYMTEDNFLSNKTTIEKSIFTRTKW